MKTAKTPYSYGHQDPNPKDNSSPSSRSPSNPVSRKTLNQGLVNFKAGDMSVATNDLGVTPNGIIRLQDVGFSASFVKPKENSSKPITGSNSVNQKTENNS